MKITKLGFIGGTSVAVLALTGIAAVAQEGPNEPDTGVNIGYDEDNHLFIWDQWDFDSNGQLDCTLGEAEEPTRYDTAHGEDGDPISVTDLEKEGGGTVEFLLIDPPDPIDPEAEPTRVTYKDSVALPTGGCGLEAVKVAGPNGQINHGQFMKLWNSMYEGTGRGCINRFLAQSDLGKDSQQIKVEDVDESPVAGLNETGVADFFSFEATCERGQKAKGSTDVQTRTKGNPHDDGDGTSVQSTWDSGPSKSGNKAKGSPKK
jgi:hypothetical protein